MKLKLLVKLVEKILNVTGEEGERGDESKEFGTSMIFPLCSLPLIFRPLYMRKSNGKQKTLAVTRYMRL